MEFEANEAGESDDDDCSSLSSRSSGGDPPSYRQELKVVEQVQIGGEEEEGEEGGEEGGEGEGEGEGLAALPEAVDREGQVVPMSMKRYKSGNGSLPTQTIHRYHLPYSVLSVFLPRKHNLVKVLRIFFHLVYQ